MKLIDGRGVARQIREEIRQKTAALSGRKPGLAFVLVGENPASRIYVDAKNRGCAQMGFYSTTLELPTTLSERDLLAKIAQLNADARIDGILVQLPLPKHLDERKILSAIDPAKDVDGFHPINIGRLLIGDPSGFIPCTPLGIATLLAKSEVPIEGSHVVILGRSNIVGKPLAALLVQKKAGLNATVTLAHSQTRDLPRIAKSADILVAAMGLPRFIGPEMIRPGCAIVDVGINRLSDGTLCGDVDFERVAPLASAITPVPGGVGPMTIAMLLQNTLRSRINHDS